MSWFNKKEAGVPAVPRIQDIPARLPEKLPEMETRGYFDMVSSADASVPSLPFDTSASKVYTSERAMRIAAAYRCVDILSGSIASLSLRLMRNRGGYFVEDVDDPINYALTVRPNYRQTAFEMIRNAVMLMLNHGNAYILPSWPGGRLTLTLLSPYSATYDKVLDEYMVNDTVNSVYGTFRSEEIIHLRNMSLDGGYTGVSTIRYACRSLGIGETIDERSLQDQQPGSSHKGFISGNDQGTKGITNLQDEQGKTVADRVGDELRKGKNIMYLQGDLKFNPLSMSPADIQFLENKKLNVLDICRFFGVHPDKAFAGQSQNYKASEMSQVQYLTDTLLPLLRKIENEFYVKLVPMSLAPKYRIQFDMESFYQTDLQSWSNYMEKTTQNGVYTVNYWRARKGQPPVPGGDVPFISCNVAPIDSPKIKGEILDQNPQNLPPKNGDKTEG